MITITETGDHHQPEWLITFTGIRNHGDAASLIGKLTVLTHDIMAARQ